MIVGDIVYHETFVKRLRRLSPVLQEQAVKTEELFRLNPLHPSLRLHALAGNLRPLWSISVTRRVRILFKRLPDGVIFFLTIGSHDVYQKAR